MKYAVVTFGCRVNQADSLGFEAALGASGATPASPESADVVIVNTCSVTASADQGARQTIRRVARANPGARIVVTGCYATRDAEAVAALPNVIRLVPNASKRELVPLVAEDLGITTAERFGSGDGSCGAPAGPGVGGRTAFTLRVQTGCAEACAYCIIPETRGAPRSVPPGEVLREVERVVAAGFREIVLTGVHLGSYGRDLSPSTSLSRLLSRLAEKDDDVLYRISSLEPMDCTRAIVDLVAGSRVMAPHFHLPLQHASNRVLEAMRRPYTIEQYRRLVDRIRERIPAASIGSDVIAGFPGERDEDADALASYLEASPLTHLHVFPYSDRPGTAASRLPERAPGAVVRERARRLREVGSALARRFGRAQTGAVRRGLTIEDGSLVVTDNYLKLRVAPGLARNRRVHVRVVAAGDGDDRGEVLPCGS